MSSEEILIIEDNASMRLGMVESLRRDGFSVFEFGSGVDALEFFHGHPVELVITDLKMEPVDGTEILKKVKTAYPSASVMVVSAFGTVNTAVEAMQLGAADFMTKPFSSEELRVRVRRIMEKIHQEKALVQLKEQNVLLQDEIFKNYGEIVGRSEPVKRVFDWIDRVAQEDSTVLIEGESGTGKELVARALHSKSPRRDRPFIKVNCGALSDSLLESELFGHEKGAFTGAVRRKKGRFELADGGSIFLDEIGDISASMQVKLLRVLQEREFERVGGEETLSVNVRVISATHRQLSKLIHEEKFREDLYYRLRVIPIALPPLRERKEDIPALVEHFLKKYADNKSAKPKTIDPTGLELFSHYSWPGNIRELQNLVERLCVISQGSQIEDALIVQHLGGSVNNFTNGLEHLSLDEALANFEKNLIVHALKKSDHVKNRAAKLLGIRTSSLYYKMEKFGLL
ncbi:sigma-54-dependent Fis family transcriptional regulator [bacterium]|nr:sigma-54-dependent Fis family transcriptional regulator [bacterium]